MFAPPRTDSSSAWTAGQKIDGRYQLVAPIGAGAMGEVWRATHLTLGRDVAVKLVRVERPVDAHELLGRFLREARAAASLRSAHVVEIFDHGSDDSTGFIAMELLEGESLGRRLERQGRLPFGAIARIACQTAAAVVKAHEAGIVHRDLKPENIFIATVEGAEVVKILDFGIAKLTELGPADALRTQEGLLIGTPSFMSPEQIMAGKDVDYRSDLWQLAVIVYECLTGRLPFESDNVAGLLVKITSGPIPPPSSFAAVPSGLDGWMARGLARAAGDRFPDAQAMVEALCAVLTPSISYAAHLAARPPAMVHAPPVSTGSPVTRGVHTTTGRGAWITTRKRGGGWSAGTVAAVVTLPLTIGAMGLAGWVLSGDGGSDPAPGSGSSSPHEPTNDAGRPLPTVAPTTTAEPHKLGLPEASAPPSASAVDSATPQTSAAPSRSGEPVAQPPPVWPLPPEEILGI